MSSGVKFNVYYKVEGNDDEFLYVLDSGSVDNQSPGKLFLQAVYSPGAVRYFISLSLDGTAFNSPQFGFLSIDDLWSWVKGKWSTLGSWYFLPVYSKIVFYANNAIAGELVIPSLVGVQSLFPALEEGEYYVLAFNGMQSPDELIYTPEDAIRWANENWGDDGMWSTDGEYLIYEPNNPGENNLNIITAGLGAFSNGFNSGFDI